jgi:hypothetical protein
MIAPNELRLGNWVDVYDSVTGSCYRQADITIIGSSEFVNPLPLTPEILEASGFEKDPHYWDGDEYYYLKPVSIKFGRDGSAPTVFLDQEEMPVQSVHQLQNLYFALVGKELVANLTANQPA